MSFHRAFTLSVQQAVFTPLMRLAGPLPALGEPHSENAAWQPGNQISNLTPPSKMVETCSKPCNFGRGAYDTTGLPKPPPPQPQ
ncbi:hypothetical protein V8C37DRAFT_398570 [Trichoderma ceciliae]